MFKTISGPDPGRARAQAEGQSQASVKVPQLSQPELSDMVEVGYEEEDVEKEALTNKTSGADNMLARNAESCDEETAEEVIRR